MHGVHSDWWVDTVVGGTSHAPGISFPPGQTFYWKVKSRFGEQGGAWSVPRSFTVSAACN